MVVAYHSGLGLSPNAVDKSPLTLTTFYSEKTKTSGILIAGYELFKNKIQLFVIKISAILQQKSFNVNATSDLSI